MRTSTRLTELHRNLGEALRGQSSAPPSKVGAERGRAAKHPDEIPAVGWMDIAWRSWGEVGEQNLFLITGGVTYALILALFPALAALVSLYGLAFDASQIEAQVNAMSAILPEQTQHLLSQQLHSLVKSSGGALGISAVIGIAVALWSASRGMSGLITGLNIAYEEHEGRSFIRLNAIALGLTIGMVIGGGIVIALVGVMPALLQVLALGPFTKWLLLIVEWPLLVVLIMTALAVLYRYAPDRQKPQWRWVSPGAIVATALWIAASIGFTVYVSHFNSYDKTYGSLGGVIVLLTWLYLSSLMVLFGAVINAQTEKQTARDSTDGTPAPMGSRGANAADTLGEDKWRRD